MNQALGLLETYGYLAAIAGLDSALKSANVALKEVQRSGGGLVTIILEGDVGAVQASVEAGSASINTLGTLVSQHVIPRIDAQTAILFGKTEICQEASSMDPPETICESETIQASETIQVSGTIGESATQEKMKAYEKSLVEKFQEKKAGGSSKKELHELKVTELRRIARNLHPFSMKTTAIKFANKAQLITAIAAHIKTEVE